MQGGAWAAAVGYGTRGAYEARHRPVGELEWGAAQLLLDIGLPIEAGGLHHLIRGCEGVGLGGEDGDVGPTPHALEGHGTSEPAAAAEDDHVLRRQRKRRRIDAVSLVW